MRIFLLMMGLTFLLMPNSVPANEPAKSPVVDVAKSKKGMVASNSLLASQLGADILAQGGNAVDAAVTTAFVLAVTWPEAGNIGGGGFMMIAPPDAEVVCVDYRETAPAAATRHSFAKWKKTRHPRMAGVPGTVRGLFLAHQKYGKLPWVKLVEPAAKLAKQGFVVDQHLANSLNRVLRYPAVQNESAFAELRRVYGHPEKRNWKTGDTIIQPDLAKTLFLIARLGPDGFYQGSVATAVDRFMKKEGGLITGEDLKNYRAVIRPAISGKFYGNTVYGAPPPSSGGITVLLTLRMVESLQLMPDKCSSWNATQVHLITEAMRRAFRERAATLGDPDFVQIPNYIQSSEFALKLAKSIDVNKATPSEQIAGSITINTLRPESKQTTHFSVYDSNGLAVSNTYTLERSYGSRIVVPGYGFLLNNEMGDFNWKPGKTTRTGQIGTEANTIAPGKRMLSSQSPTIVKRDGKVILLVGSPGGRTIINTVTEILIQSLAFGRPLEKAVDAPRFHHQWFPDILRLEDHEDLKTLIPALKEKGHRVSSSPGSRQGSAHCIAIDPETGTITGVGDRRRGGNAVGVK